MSSNTLDCIVKCPVTGISGSGVREERRKKKRQLVETDKETNRKEKERTKRGKEKDWTEMLV